MHLAIIPKRYETFNRCLDYLCSRPNRQAYQSELKRIVYSKSWRQVVKREFSLWNRLLSSEFEGLVLVEIIPCANPATGRANEVLWKIPQQLEVLTRNECYTLKTNGGKQP